MEKRLPTSQAKGLLDVLPGGGTKGGEPEDFMAFLCPWNVKNIKNAKSILQINNFNNVNDKLL